MNPKHIKNVPNDRKAVAPYNFVELPEQIVKAQNLPSSAHYHSDRHTGRIECTLTTESPLYIRCGMTPSEFKAGKESTDLPGFFYTDKSDKPIIPGSSLRGMLRTLVEIVSFSKIDRVSDQDRLFFRAVAANPNKESWGEEYKKYVNSQKIQAGYLKKDNQGWYIQPAKTVKKSTFAWVKEKDLTLNLKKFDDSNYQPQYIPVSYDKNNVNIDRAKRLFAGKIELPNTYLNQGTLVTSGNMKQGNEQSPRRNHCLVFEAEPKAIKLRIDNEVINHYRNALTDFQMQSPFDKDWGSLIQDKPIFYSTETGDGVGFFGQSPNFRIPYSPNGNGYATTVKAFIPCQLKNFEVIDIADTIFGWVKQDSKDQPLDKDQKQRVGRVFITDAKYQSAKNALWYKENYNDTVTPQILSEPKPTTFQHYLVQPEETQADKKNLKHYASELIQDTVIRGHKLYWHKGSAPTFEHPKPNEPKIQSQITKIKPINKDVTFKFTIYFENLTDVELGALLWVLNHAQGDYRLKLGMGKPLGMGAVKIENNLYSSNRQKRYTHLFDSEQWATEEKHSNLTKIASYISDFESYIINEIHESEYPEGFQATRLYELPRIQMLLAMLNWSNYPESKNTRYMEIECDPSQQKCIGKPKKDGKVNEYAERLVLPTPLAVMGRPDNRRLPSVKPSSENPLPKPQKKIYEKLKLPSKSNNLDQPKNNNGGNVNLAMQRPSKSKKD